MSGTQWFCMAGIVTISPHIDADNAAVLSIAYLLAGLICWALDSRRK